MPKDPTSVPPFSSGNSLFVFEGDQVRVLGDEGTEATVPLEDLKALLEHLAQTSDSPDSRVPGLLEHDDEE